MPSAAESELHLHDTLTRERRRVFAEDGRQLRFYCCGPTVYGPAHIGNFRTFVVQDLFRRVVELTGLPTRHVRNITDVDDKTIRESQSKGESLREFTRRWTDRFHADCEALNVLPPHDELSAIEHIAEQIRLIEKLIDRGLAYQAPDGSVYYRVAAFEPYGRLSHLDKRELRLGAAASAHRSDEYDKDSLADFALWKARRPEDGDNFWPSPWGEGRPGWHLECSAMSMKALGESFDLHSGGIDLIFPHHENEIAQSEGATGRTFSRHWFHVAHLLVEGEKMSKSLGNLFTLDDIVARGHSAAELRYALLAGHYRHPLNFTLDSLHAAQVNLQRLADLAAGLAAAAGDEVPPPVWDSSSFDDVVAQAARGAISPGPFREAFEALLSDLNTPGALGKVFSAAKPLESALASGTLDASDARDALEGLGFILAAFGFRTPEPIASPAAVAAPAEIEALARRRWEAKSAKDWSTADALRDELKAMGWEIRDTRDGYEVKPAGSE